MKPLVIAYICSLISLLVSGAYNDFQNSYLLVTSAKSWSAASADCKARGLELAPITSEAERVGVMSRISSSQSTYTGVRCKTAGVAHDWSYDGSTYVQSTGSAKNSNWCGGEPNGNCSGEQCMHIYTSGCWNDIGCGNAYPYICGMPSCKREQTLYINNQSAVRISQGDSKQFPLVFSSPKYTDSVGAPDCPLQYTCDSNCGTGSSATATMPAESAAGTQLVNRGVTPSGMITNCNGDCDNDTHCTGNTVCGQSEVPHYVPGCRGKTGDPGITYNYDFCYLPESQIKMTISALTVNKTAVSTANWTTTKSFTAHMLSSTTAGTASSSIHITVVPCAISEVTIASMSTAIGNTVQATHSVFTYTDSISTVAACGAIVYELVSGSAAGLSYNTSTRQISWNPTTLARLGNNTGTIRAKAANFPLNIKSKSFTVVGLTPCTLIPTTIPNKLAHVGQTVTWTISAYSLTSASYGCGTLTYQLVGGNTSWLSFNASTRVLTLNTQSHSDIGVNKPSTIKAWGSSWPNNDSILNTFTVTIEKCTLNNVAIPNKIAHVGETINWTVPLFTWSHNGNNNLSTCGPLVYELVGASGKTTWLTFAVATRVLTLRTNLHSDVGVNKAATVRATGAWQPPAEIANQAFTVTIEPCTLVSKVIPNKTVHIGQRTVWTVTAFTWTHPNRNYLSACGAVTYQLEGAATTYLAFVPATRVLTLYSWLNTDQRTATSRTVTAYPANFQSQYSITSVFTVTLNAPCSELGYMADRKAIPLPPSLHKYVLSTDGTVYYDFAFNYLPTSCNYWKVYTLAVETYPAGVNVASYPWLTVDTGQTTPPGKLRVIGSNNNAYEGYYTVTVKSKLYNTSAFNPEIKFKIYLHRSPCLKTSLHWGTNKPQNMAYQINRGAVNTQNYFDQVVNFVPGCGLNKYSLKPDKVAALNIISNISVNLKPSPSAQKTQIASTDASVFTTTTSNVQLEYYVTENHSLIDDLPNKRGVYTFEVRASLNTYPLFDEFTEIKRTITLTITDVCTDEMITSPSISDMAFQIRNSPTSVVQDFADYTDVNSEFCGTIAYTLTYTTGPGCGTWSAASSACTKAKSLIIYNQAQSKFTINPSIAPLKITNPHGATPSWYDHSLLGQHTFKLSATWSPSTAFPPIGLPTGVPTSEIFKVTITSVCQAEAITKTTINDMAYQIRQAPASVLQNWTGYSDNYNQFCGTIDYTLTLVSSPKCSSYSGTTACVNSKALIVFDKPNTKFTIVPTASPLKMALALQAGVQWQDHSLLGVHNFNLAASWINSQAFPTLVPLPSGVPTSKNFKVTITSVCQLEAITKKTISNMAFQIRQTPAAVVQNWTSFTDVYNQFCGVLTYTLTLASSPKCSSYSAASANCVSSKGLIVFTTPQEWIHCANEWASCTCTGSVRFGADVRWVTTTSTGTKPCNYTGTGFGSDPASGSSKTCQCNSSVTPSFNIKPTQLPLKMTKALQAGVQWYDHSLLGIHNFNLACSWTNSQAFPTHVALPSGVPTSTNFAVTITSVCQSEAITKTTISNMAFLIRNAPTNVLQTPTRFTDNYNQFCGVLTYTLTQVSSPRCATYSAASAHCVNSKGLIVFTTPQKWIHCANEWGSCTCLGSVRFGADSRWATTTSTGTKPCNHTGTGFGSDPAYLTVKTCQCGSHVAPSFDIKPTQLPLKMNHPLQLGVQWYDHSLLGVHNFNLAVSWTNSQSFPTHVSLPSGVPTSDNFSVTITSVCQSDMITQKTILDMAFQLRESPTAEVQDFDSYTDVYNQFCGKIKYTLTLQYSPRCGVWNGASTDCTKFKGIVVFDEPNTKFTIDPASLPLKMATVSLGTQWYDHSLLGVGKFHITATWINSQAFPTYVPLPSGVPTSKFFWVTMTSVCQLENMIFPNAALPIVQWSSKINQAVIPNMTFKIDIEAVATVTDFTPFLAVYGRFCGDIDYTLRYVTGVRRVSNVNYTNVKDLSLITLDKTLTKLSITPNLLQTVLPPHEVYDHTFVGEHDLVLEVGWINSQAFPTLVPLPTNHPVQRPFKVFITSVCNEAYFQAISPALKPVTLKVYDHKDWNVLLVDAFMDSVSARAIKSFSRPKPPTKVEFCGVNTYTSEVTEWQPTVFKEKDQSAYQVLDQSKSAIPTPTALTTEDIVKTNQMKINLTKADSLYGEVGYYELQMKVNLVEYTQITENYLLRIHVLYPCKNIRPYPTLYKSDEAWKGDIKYLYAGSGTQAYYTTKDFKVHVNGNPFKSYAQALYPWSEQVLFGHYDKLLSLDHDSPKDLVCGRRKTSLRLCDPNVANAEDIQKAVKIYTEKTAKLEFGRGLETLEIKATLASQVGKHEFCWSFDFTDLPSEQQTTLRVQPTKFIIEIETSEMLDQLKKTTPKLDWQDSTFRAIKSGSTLEYFDGDRIYLNYETNDLVNAIPELQASPRDLENKLGFYSEKTDKKEINVLVTQTDKSCNPDKGGTAKGLCAEKRQSSFQELVGQSITYIFKAQNGADSITKQFTLKFSGTQKVVVKSLKVARAPVKCSGNLNNGSSKNDFVQVNQLTENDWKESKSGIYFDCTKKGKKFVVDPVKLEEGIYSEVESRLEGDDVGSCCKAFKSPKGAPKIQQVHVDNKGLVEINFNQPMMFDDLLVDSINGARKLAGKDEHLPFEAFYYKGFQKVEPEFAENDMVDWKLVNATGDKMHVQLNFTHPLWVSGSDFPCEIGLYFGNGTSFKNSGYGQPLEKNVLYRKRLPKLVPLNDGLTNFVEGATEGLKYLLLGLSGVSCGLGPMWALIEGLQLFVHYPMLLVDATANVEMFRTALRPLATLEILSDWEFKKRAWFYSESEELDAKMEASGYTSNLFQFTLGVPLYLVAIAVAMVPFVLIIQLVEYCYQSKARQEELKEGGEEDDDQRYVRNKAKAPRIKRKRRKILTVQQVLDVQDAEEAATPDRVQADSARELVVKDEQPLEPVKAKVPKTCCGMFRACRLNLTFNFFFRYFYVLTLEIAISIALGYGFIWTTSPNYYVSEANKYLVPVFAGLFLLFFLKLIYNLTRDGEQMLISEPRQGSLYENLDYQKYPNGRAVLVIFILKRLAFTAMCVLMPFVVVTKAGYLPTQHSKYARPLVPETTMTISLKSILILMAMVMTLGSMAFLAHRNPYNGKLRYGLECLNELFFYVSILGFQCFFTNLMPPPVAYNLGWIMCLVILAFLAVHVSTFIVYEIVKPLMHYLKVKRFKDKLVKDSKPKAKEPKRKGVRKIVEKIQAVKIEKKRTKAELSKISEVQIEEDSFFDKEDGVTRPANQILPRAELKPTGSLLLAQTRTEKNTDLVQAIHNEPENSEVFGLVSQTLLDDKSAIAELRNQVLEEMRLNDPEQFAQLQLSDLTKIDAVVAELVAQMSSKEQNEQVTSREPSRQVTPHSSHTRQAGNSRATTPEAREMTPLPTEKRRRKRKEQLADLL